jgi:hypothetical protein
MSFAAEYSSVPMVSPLGDNHSNAIADVDWFTAEPSAERAVSLASAWRRFWQLQARSALEAAAEGVDRSLFHLIQGVLNLDFNRRLSPRVSGRLAALMDAMTREDGYGVFDTLQAWISDRPDQWYADECVLESVATQDWEVPLLHEIRSTRVEGVAPLQVFPLLEEELTPYFHAFTQALGLIRQVDPEMCSEIETHVCLIKLFNGRGIEGLSSPKAFGAIWLKAPDKDSALTWFLEHLVHECSHLHLNALMAFDPLLTNPNEIHRSPIRPDPRPMFQVLHATFVLFRNRRVHARLHAMFPDLNLGPALQEFDLQFNNGVAVLNEFMKPTVNGQKLLESFRANTCGLSVTTTIVADQ